MKLRLVRDLVTPSLNRIERNLNQIPKEAYDYFKDITPKASGNAKNKTRLQGNTINANYNYATELDKGRSRQAPKGMTKPTKEFINRLVRQGVKK